MTDPNAQQPQQPQQPAYQQPQQPAYQQQAYQPAPGYAAPSGPKALSLTSMILGIAGLVLGLIIGWFTFGIMGLASIAAVITGHIGSKKEPQAKGFWITGLITGYIGVAFAVIAIIVAIVIAATVTAAIGSLGTISTTLSTLN